MTVRLIAKLPTKQQKLEQYLQALGKKKQLLTRILYSVNLYFKSEDEINTFFNQKKSENNSAVAVPH